MNAKLRFIEYDVAAKYKVPYVEKYAVRTVGGNIIVLSRNFSTAWIVRIPQLTDDQLTSLGLRLQGDTWVEAGPQEN